MTICLWVGALEWVLALAWAGRAPVALLHQRDVPDLLAERYGGQIESATLASISVVVPALNEEAAVGACLRSLLASNGVRLEIIAVDDRSSDATGAIMDAVAEEAGGSPHTLRVLHIRELPAGWLGKPHALWRGAAISTAPLLLFTDADAFFAPDALARCVRFVEQEEADHLVLLPTPILRSPGERMMLGMIQALGIWGVRLWKIADARARDSIGVGCFNLLTREAYLGIGGFDSLRMEVVEDLRLGYLVKAHGYRQRVAFGADLLRLHWAAGALGIVHGLEKNFFAITRYRPLVALGGLLGTAVLMLGPVAGLLGGWAVRLPALLAMTMILTVYVAQARRTRISAMYFLLFPVASSLILYAMARSAVVTLARGGVSWRGTFYPLAELRRHAGPLWRWQAEARRTSAR